jgi:hypothetical protein
MTDIRTTVGRWLINLGKWVMGNQGPARVPAPNILTMFDPAARHELEEMLGYERFVLWECGNAIRGHSGQVGPTRITFHSNGTQSLQIAVHDTIGETGASMVPKIAPLILTSSQKTLDMLFEWIIVQNDIDCPFQFWKKLEIIKRANSLIYPDFLATDLQIQKAVKGLFKELTPYRNAITHNVWGKAVDGDLKFDFVDLGGQHYVRTVAFDTLLALADTTELIATMVVQQSANQAKLDTLRWLLDKLAAFHGQPLFNINQPRFFMVTEEADLPEAGSLTVDLANIRNVLNGVSSGGPSTFDLRVLATGDPHQVIWNIPAANVPATASLVLDHKWDNFKTQQPAAVAV